MVFGDIGTSPLYTFNSIYTELHAVPGQDDVRQGFSATWWHRMATFHLVLGCFRHVSLGR